MKRILFIGHEATRTGAPVVLLHLLRWLSQRAEFEIDLLLLSGGDLLPEYQKLARVFVVPGQSTSIVSRGYRKLKKGLLQENNALKSHGLAPFKAEYDVVIGNTALTLEHLSYFKQRGAKTICWLHELEWVIRSLFTAEKFRVLTGFVDTFIGGSRAVETMLLGFGIDRNVEIVHDFSVVDTAAIYDTAMIRSRLGISPDGFVVIGSGTLEWRKGVDIFLQTAMRLTAEIPDIHFIWVAGASAPTNPIYDEVMFDLARIDQKDRITILELKDRPAPYFAAADLFLLTSREDTFPLVCLEAAALGKPIVCFEKAGGMPEFVGSDAGTVVAYLDTEALGRAIRSYYDDRNMLELAGKAAKEKVGDKFSPDRSCQRINDIIGSI